MTLARRMTLVVLAVAVTLVVPWPHDGLPSSVHSPPTARHLPGTTAGLPPLSQPGTTAALPPLSQPGEAAALPKAAALPSPAALPKAAGLPSPAALPKAAGLPRAPKPGEGFGLPQLRQPVRPSSMLVAVHQLLEDRTRALALRDRTAWMATVDPAATGFRRAQSRLFDNLVRLPLGDSFGYGPPLAGRGAAGADSGPGATSPRITVTGSYAFAGFDEAEHHYELHYTVVHRDGRWLLGADPDGPTQRQPFDLPGLQVLDDGRALVIGNAPTAQLRDYARLAARGMTAVRRVWGDGWPGHAVLVLPSTSAQFAELVRAAHAGPGLDQVAATTQGPIGPGGRAKADMVVVNPLTYGELSPAGRQSVIGHELTHVAARSSTIAPVPTWLSEGMADFVGYRDTGLPRAVVADALLRRVRDGKGPTRLPTAADFDPATSTIAPSYNAAWLACARLADRYGTDRLVAFYRAVAGGAPADPAVSKDPEPPTDPEAMTDRAFVAVLGTTREAFVADWLAYLRALAARPG